MKRFQKTGLFFLSFLLLSLCFGCSRSDKNENEEEKTFTKYFDVMTDSQGNMVLPLNTSLQLTMTDEQALQQAAEIIEQKLPRWHQLADSHHAYLDENGEPLHNLYYINQHPGQTLEVDPWLLQLLQQIIQPGVMRIKGFAVDPGAAGQLLDRNLIVIHFADHRLKRIPDRLAGFDNPQILSVLHKTSLLQSPL